MGFVVQKCLSFIFSHLVPTPKITSPAELWEKPKFRSAQGKINRAGAVTLMQERKRCIGGRKDHGSFGGRGESGFVDLGPATLLPPGSRVGVDD